MFKPGDKVRCVDATDTDRWRPERFEKVETPAAKPAPQPATSGDLVRCVRDEEAGGALKKGTYYVVLSRSGPALRLAGVPALWHASRFERVADWTPKPNPALHAELLAAREALAEAKEALDNALTRLDLARLATA